MQDAWFYFFSDCVEDKEMHSNMSLTGETLNMILIRSLGDKKGTNSLILILKSQIDLTKNILSLVKPYCALSAKHLIYILEGLK